MLKGGSMEDEYDKTVSVYDYKKTKSKNKYCIVICDRKGHKLVNLNDFNKEIVTFGRNKGNDIVINSNLVSGSHGKFIFNDGLKVFDNNSTNGLFINNKLQSEALLEDGDLIKIDNPDESLDQGVVISVVIGDKPITKCPNCDESLSDSKYNETIKSEKHEEEHHETHNEESISETKNIGNLCLKCGNELSSSQEFCPKCGTKRGEVNNKVCPNCGNVIAEGEKFCPKCGQKTKFDISETTKNVKENIKTNKKTIIKVLIGVAAVAVIAVFGFIFIPPMLVTVEEYLQEGNYEKAYAKAKTQEEKDAVLLENIIAVTSYEISEGLKDPTSFKLSHVYFDGDSEIVFEIIAKNSYGGNVTNYYDYRYDKDDKKFTRYLYLWSLEDETTYSWDSYEEKLEKIIKNVVRKTIITIMNNSSFKVDSKVVDRVNKLFKEEKKRDLKLIPEVSEIYPNKSKDEM